MWFVRLALRRHVVAPDDEHDRDVDGREDVAPHPLDAQAEERDPDAADGRLTAEDRDAATDAVIAEDAARQARLDLLAASGRFPAAGP